MNFSLVRTTLNECCDCYPLNILFLVMANKSARDKLGSMLAAGRFLSSNCSEFVYSALTLSYLLLPFCTCHTG